MPLESAAAPIHPAAVQPAPVVSAPVETLAPAVQATLPLTPVVAAAPDPNVMSIPKTMYEEFLGYKDTVAKLEADRQAAEVAKKDLELQAQIKNGQFQEVITNFKKEMEDKTNAERAQRAAIEKRAEKYALSSQLSTALSGQNLVPGAASQLSTLWANEFVVEPAGDSYAVRTPAFQSVGDFVAAKLASTEYAHFVRASSVGGTGSSHAPSQSAPTPAPTPAAPVQPANFGEAILLQMASAKKANSVDPRIAATTTASGERVATPGFMKGIRQA